MTNLYDGKIYSLIIDPQMKGLHGLIAKQIPKGHRVLDACCGTGALAFRLASQCSEVVGVDLSPRMIEHAKRKQSKLGIGNVSFHTGDVSRLDHFKDHAFAYATVVMAIHEMPCEARDAVLQELTRVADRTLLVDFAAPMRWNLPGIRNRFFEALAGRRHFRCFRDYMRSGGLSPLFSKIGASVEAEQVIDKGNKVLVIVTSTRKVA